MSNGKRNITIESENSTTENSTQEDVKQENIEVNDIKPDDKEVEKTTSDNGAKGKKGKKSKGSDDESSDKEVKDKKKSKKSKGSSDEESDEDEKSIKSKSKKKGKESDDEEDEKPTRSKKSVRLDIDEESSSQIVSISMVNFDPKRLVGLKPEKKEISDDSNKKKGKKSKKGDKGNKVVYYLQPFKYTYDEDGRKVEAPFAFEGPDDMDGLDGIVEGEFMGKVNHQIYTVIDVNNKKKEIAEEHKKFYTKIDAFYERIAEELFRFKDDCDLGEEESVKDIKKLLAYPAYRKKGTDKKLLEGWNPAIYSKVVMRRRGGTVFTGIDGKNIPVNMLFNVDIKYKPLYIFRGIFIGIKVKPQIDLASGLVSRITPNSDRILQSKALSAYKDKQGAIEEYLKQKEAQKKLKSEEEKSLPKGKSKKSKDSDEESQSQSESESDEDSKDKYTKAIKKSKGKDKA